MSICFIDLDSFPGKDSNLMYSCGAKGYKIRIKLCRKGRGRPYGCSFRNNGELSCQVFGEAYIYWEVHRYVVLMDKSWSLLRFNSKPFLRINK